MYIDGYAFKPNEKELMKANSARYDEIKHLAAAMDIRKNPQYGMTRFDGKLPTEEHRKLSPKDVALIADHGNLCFGGTCSIHGDSFDGTYNIG